MKLENEHLKLIKELRSQGYNVVDYKKKIKVKPDLVVDGWDEIKIGGMPFEFERFFFVFQFRV